MTTSHPRRQILAGLTAAALGVAGLIGLAGFSSDAHAATAPTKLRVLFDAAHAETAGNADWIISTSQPDPLGENPNPSAETDWTGALSAWGVALQKTGQYSLKTLPAGNTFSYGSSAALDLSNFDAVVIDEPNTVFTAAEKTALMNYVKNGGGLFLISDHTGSDRNNDGWDSPAVINDLMTNNSVDSTDPFGFSVDLLNIVKDTPKAISDPSSPILNGSFGTVTGSNIYNGTTFTLNPADNPAVKGLLWRTGYSSTGTTGAFFVTSGFGSGRVAVWGDSSPADDGTGEPGKTVYDGWDDPTGTNAPLALNATAWLAGGSGGSASTGTPTPTPTSTPTPSNTPTSTPTATPTPTGGGCTAVQLLGNGGFESGSASPWTVNTAGNIYSGSAEPAHSGSYDAWLDGYGTTTTDTLAQTVTLPTGCSSYQLSYYLHVDTAETTTSTAYDTLKVQVLDSSGSVLGTVGSFSNLDHASGYQLHTADLSAYAGRTVTLKFTGTEDSTAQTSFVIDDAALKVS